ncbi:coatomer subunit alpha [Pancytospora philotis]|nr:coatomer subunit alpha [Pancytospora philotis]
MSKQMQEFCRRATTRVKSVAFHPYLPSFVTANHCGQVCVWNHQYMQRIATLRGHSGSVRIVKFHPSGELLATAGDDKVVRVWSYKTRELMQAFHGHTDYVRSLDFHPTRPWLVSAGDDTTIRVWNYSSGEKLCSTSGHNHYIMSVLFIDSTHIVSGSLDHTICLWSCESLMMNNKSYVAPGVVRKQTVEAHDRGVNILHFRDGTLYSGADDRELKTWRYSGESLIPEKSLHAEDGNITGIYVGGAALDGSDIFAVSEEGSALAYTKGRASRIDVGARCWAVAGKDDAIVIGTDDGFVFYRRGGGLVGCCTKEKRTVYYLKGGQLYKRIGGNDETVYGITRELQRIDVMEESSDNLLLQYDGKYELIRNGRRMELAAGSAAFHGGSLYVLRDGAIYKDDSRIDTAAIDADRLLPTDAGVFAVGDKQFSLLSDTSGSHVCYTSFPIKSVVTMDGLMAVFGPDRIAVYDSGFNLVQQIEERAEISGGCFYAYKGGPVLVYATARQLKYFYQGVGMLISISSCLKPLFVYENAPNSMSIQYVNSEGAGELSVGMGEIAFREAVAANGDVISVIEKEHLPGMAPVNYLIANGKGAAALPYVNDDSIRFELFLSENNFAKALEMCAGAQMYRKLSLKALDAGAYDIAEECFRELDDDAGLFFLYVSTKQLDKLSLLEGSRMETAAKILVGKLDFGDMELNDGLDAGSDDPIAVKVGSMGIEPQPKQDAVVHNDSDTGEDGMANTATVMEEEPDDLSDGLGSVADNASENAAQGSPEGSDELAELPAEIEDAASYAGEQLESSGESGALSSLASNFCSNTSGPTQHSAGSLPDSSSLHAVNDSEPPMNLFDPALITIETAEPGEADAALQEALALTTQGKFVDAVESFRRAIMAIALQLSSPEDQLEQRRLIGAYLWGLGLEIERKKLSDPAKSIQLALFFASLPLEHKHASMAQALAANVCFKNENVKTARELAETLPASKLRSKILDAPLSGDKHTIETGDVCYDTLAVEQWCKGCPLCFVKSKKGDVCGACSIGLLE